jgi:hypothetical protein
MPTPIERVSGEKARRLTGPYRVARNRLKAIPPRIREIAISVMIVAVLVIGVVGNLPDASLTRAVTPAVDTVAVPLGLEQNWSMYAPNPPRRQENIEVHIAMADGTEKVWTLPRLNPVFGVAFSHRWRRFKESLLTEKQLRPDFVHWVVREMTTPGDHPIRADLLLLTEKIPPPGVSGDGATNVETLYTENLTPNR